MLWRIHRKQVTKRGLFLFRVIALLVSQDHEPRSIGEQLRLLGDLYDIRMLGDRPEGLGIGTVVPVHWLMVAQVRPFAMRIAVLLVVLRTDNVEAGTDSCSELLCKLIVVLRV